MQAGHKSTEHFCQIVPVVLPNFPYAIKIPISEGLWFGHAVHETNKLFFLCLILGHHVDGKTLMNVNFPLLGESWKCRSSISYS